MKKIIVTIIAATLLCVFSQKTHAQTGFDIEDITNQVHLLISMNTNSFSSNSVAAISLMVTNASTNIVVIVTESPLINASFFCINNFGKKHEILRYDIDPSSYDRAYYHPGSYPANPKGSYQWSIGWNIKPRMGPSLPPGKYKFGTTRTVRVSYLGSTNTTSVELKSNLLEFQIQ